MHVIESSGSAHLCRRGPGRHATHARRRPPGVAALAVASLLLAACATQGDIPTANLAVARNSVAQAEALDAPRLAPIEYQNARDKLVRADEAAKGKRYDDARVLADEAAADADVAGRRARAVKAQNQAAELQRANAALAAEGARTTQTTTTVVVPTPGVGVTRETQTTTTVVTPATPRQ